MILRGLLCAAALVLSFGPLAAQSLPEDDVESVKDTFAETTNEAPEMLPGLDLEAWEVFAKNAADILEKGTASHFALTRVRAETVIWRDQFLTVLDVNGPRLSTVSNQIAAIAPAEGGELTDPVLTSRMEELDAQFARLSLPGILANEAHVQAIGLVSEADVQIRAREAVRLSTRSASPVNFSLWPAVLTTVAAAVSQTTHEVTALAKTLAADGRFWSRLAVAIICIAMTLFFTMRIRAWIASLKDRELKTTDRTAFVIRFVISLGSVVLPIVALTLLSVILTLSGFVGLSGSQLLEMLPVAGGAIFIAKWLADWYFPTKEDDDGILGYDLETRIKARRLVVWLSWVFGIRAMFSMLLETKSASDTVEQVAGFPLQIVLGLLLWRLGAVIVHSARPESDAIFKKNRVRKFIGRAAQAFAVLGPLASAFGYAAAAQSITGPAIISLVLFAVVVVLQRLSYAITSPDVVLRTLDEGEASELSVADLAPSGLLPIAINTVLLLLCFPLLALLWGASPANLIEIWTRFRAGFSVGDINVSPTTFVTFGVVLVLGYFITSAIKSSLKTSVLPRTRLDLGGQNAVVAGVGYLGLTLSALAAFTIAGIDLSSLALVAGALSLGIGFGLQNIVQNFVAGIILLIERPVSEGDMIEVGGQMGYVRDISVRSTRIETFDRTDVIVPNADLISNQVINWTRGNLVGRSIIPIGVAYGSDTKQVSQILQEVIEAHPMVLLNPPPSVLLMQFGADSIDFEIRAILRDVNFIMIVKSEVLHEIVTRFDDAGIEIPFAQRDIWLRNPEVLTGKGDDK